MRKSSHPKGGLSDSDTGASDSVEIEDLGVLRRAFVAG
jgi:hypothetical protein